MVKYDSQSKELRLMRRYSIAGDTPTSLIGNLDLSKLSNQEQQRLIAVAKLAMAFSGNHDVAKGRVVETDGVKSIAPSIISETQRVINQAKPLGEEQVEKSVL